MLDQVRIVLVGDGMKIVRKQLTISSMWKVVHYQYN